MSSVGDGRNSSDDLDDIAETIRADPELRQLFINAIAKRDVALGKQVDQDSAATLGRDEKGSIQRLLDLGFEEKPSLIVYVVPDNTTEHTTKSTKANSKPPASGESIGESLAQRISENSALFEAHPQSFGSILDRERRVVETLFFSPRTDAHTNLPSFHIIKLPPLAGRVSHLRLSVEFCIQTLGGGVIWWTSYVLISRKGTLTRGTGVYTDWDEFGRVISHPPTGIIAPRTDGIRIVDISKGVLNKPANGTVLRMIDLKALEHDLEIFVALVATGMYDGKYQVHGHAMLEYRVTN